MKTKLPLILLLIVSLSVFASSCGGSDRDTEIAVIVALTQTAAVLQSQPAQPVDLPTSTPQPAPAVEATSTTAPAAAPLKGYQPLDPALSASLNDAVSAAIGLTGTVTTTADFSDRMNGQSGTATQFTYNTTVGAIPAGFSPFAAASSTLTSLGWTEDINYGAGGPYSLMTGFRKDATLCLVSYKVKPVDPALCSPNEPVGSCYERLSGDQLLYHLTLACSTYYP